MKLTVLIRRQRSDEPQPGTLRAFVVQEGKRGANLLDRHQFTDVERVKQEVRLKLRARFPAGGSIRFSVEEAE